MSLLFIDSFDHYATGDLPLKWSAVANGQATIAATSGRRSGGALGITSTSWVRKDFAGAQTMIVGAAFRLGATPASWSSPVASAAMLQFSNSQGPHIYIAVGGDGSLAVWRYSTSSTSLWEQLGQTTGAILQAAVYAYIEVKVTISATVGQVKILINGANVLNLINVNTRGLNATNDLITSVTLSNPGGSGSVTSYYDDLYLCDTAGTRNNDFFGDVRIDAVLPNADGSYRDFVPDSGTAHFSRVNEAVADQTTYVASSTLGGKDSYGFTDLTAIVGNVRGVQLVDAATKDDAGARSISHLAKQGVSEQYSSAIALSTDRKLYTTVHETDPATGSAWTQAGINSAEFGVVVAV